MLNTVQRDKQREDWERRKREAPKGHVFEDRDTVIRNARAAFEELYRCDISTYAECRDGPLIPQEIEALPASSGRGRTNDRRNRTSRKAR